MRTLQRKPNLLFMIIVRTPTICLTTTLQQSLKRIPFECKLLRALKLVERTELSHFTYLYLPHLDASLLHSFDDQPAAVTRFSPHDTSTTYFWYYAQKRHRGDDKPATITQRDDGSTTYRWFKNNYEHRDGDLPSYIVDGVFENDQLVSFARIDYSKNGVLHREGNPAIIMSDGSQYWYINGEHYRENNLPAVIRLINGLAGLFRYEYYENGKMIRFEDRAS